MKAQDLKNSILQQAIQGKLVPQDPNDEPAEVLYAKIQAEKQRLIKEGKIKKDKPLSPIPDDEVPFSIPPSWKWVRLGDCSTVYTGNSIPEDIKRHRYTGISEGYDYIGTKDVNFDRTINYNNGVKIPYSEPKFKLANKNSILLCIEGGSAGRKLAIVDRDVCFGNKLCSINPINISMMYIFYFIQSPYFRSIFNDNATGIIGGVSVNKLQELLIPLPPLAEQKRIVLKFEALDPLIKRYDKVETELAELIDDFPEQLKKSGLKFYLNNSDFPVYRLENIITFGPKNGYSPKAVDYETKIKNLTLTATSSGKFDKKYFKYVDIDISTDSYLWLKKGDILIQRGNALSYVGISAVYDNNETNYIYPDLMVKIIANPKIVDSEYLHLYLNSPEIRKYYMDAAIGTSDSMPKINHKIILNTQIKIPPLAEQHRIVAKVNELMQYCEKLKN